MGTRHLIAVKIDGAYKVAQYGQWDGYPEGQGVTVLNFLTNTMDRPRFEAACRNCRFVERTEILDELVRFGADPENDYSIRLDDYDRFSATHPEWSRDTGAGILDIIQNCGGCGLKDEIAFAADSLFCEWAYIIDFDENTLEVYSGFNHNPLSESDRFFFLEGKAMDGYHPIRLVKAWALDALPSNDDFLAALAEEDEDGEEE